MHFQLSRFFHARTKRLGNDSGPIPQDASLWPEEWKTVVYKDYPRFTSVSLDSTQEAHPFDIFNAIKRRRSAEKFVNTPIDKSTMALLLQHSCGIVETDPNKHPHRAQPSGGGMYPLETYVLVFKSSKQLQSGVYHYDVKRHALHVIEAREFPKPEIKKYFSYSLAADAAAAILLTAVFERTQQKYGQRGYRLLLLEAGHIAQNIYLVSEALGLGCRALAGTYDEQIEQLIRVDGLSESLVYSLVVGNVE